MSKEHANTCDLVGFRQGYNAPAVCSCGAEQAMTDASSGTPDLLFRIKKRLGLGRAGSASSDADLLRDALTALREQQERITKLEDFINGHGLPLP